MIVPAEYTTIDVLSDGRFLLTRYENQASSFYYADASGTVTPIQTPVKGTYFGMAGDDCFFIGVYAKRPLTAAVQQPAEQYDIPTLVLLDENMKVIRDDIDGACGAVSTPHFTNGLMPIQTGSTLWIGSRKGAIGNGTYGLIDKTGQFVGKHDFDELSWYSAAPRCTSWTAKAVKSSFRLTLRRKAAGPRRNWKPLGNMIFRFLSIIPG